MIGEKRIKILDDDTDTRQELDLDFLSSGYRRKLYVASRPGIGCRRPPRRTNTPVLLVPIPIGEGVFGYLIHLDGRDRVVERELLAGRYYYVPPSTPYEIRVVGTGALELFAPVASEALWFDEEPLPDDFFAGFPEAPGGVTAAAEAHQHSS